MPSIVELDNKGKLVLFFMVYTIANPFSRGVIIFHEFSALEKELLALIYDEVEAIETRFEEKIGGDRQATTTKPGSGLGSFT